jgi:hypothetical protein
MLSACASVVKRRDVGRNFSQENLLGGAVLSE